MAEKKIIDVASAADSKVDIGSKPMIIGHKSMATDPMVREKQEELVSTENAPKDVQEKTSEVKSEIEPPSAKQKSLEPLADSKDEKPVAVDDKSVEPKPDSEPDKKEEEPDVEEKKAEELDPVALQMEKDDKIRELISRKKYFVSIKQANSGSFKKWVFGLIFTILLALIGLFVLIDTGTLDLGVKLPFTIFGEEKSLSSSSDKAIEQPAQQQDTSEEKVEEATVAPVAEETTQLKTITEVDILLTKVGDESDLPNVTPESFIDFIASKLKTFECSVDSGGYRINKISDEFVSGLVGCEGGYAAYWYILEGQWQEFGTQDTPPCDDVEALKIPEEFIPVCIDTKTNIEKVNPNGSINQ